MIERESATSRQPEVAVKYSVKQQSWYALIEKRRSIQNLGNDTMCDCDPGQKIVKAETRCTGLQPLVQVDRDKVRSPKRGT